MSTAVVWLALGAATVLSPSDAASRRASALSTAQRLAGAGSGAGSGPRSAAGEPGMQAVGRGGAAVAVALGVVLGALLGGPALAVAAGTAALLGWHLLRRSVAGRTTRRDQAALVRAVRVLVGELEAGAGPAAALMSAAATGGSCAATLDAAGQAAARGDEASEVLLAGSGDLRLVGHAWRIGEGSGAALMTVLQRVAADLEAGAGQRRAAAVALAGPRSSAVLLAGLPLVGIGLGISMGADPLGFLLGSATGRAVCAAGVLFDVAGIAWMSRILRRAEAA